MRQLLLVWLAAGCVGPFGSTRRGSASGTGTSVVREFCRRFGSRDFRRIAGLFAANAVFEIDGLGIVLQGRHGIWDLAEYGAAVGSRFTVTELTEFGDTVRCHLEEHNEWCRLLGVESVSYAAWFVLRRGRIERAMVKLEPASREELRRGLAEFLVWLAATDPAALEKVMPGGKLRADAQTGMRLLDLLRRWCSR